MMAAIASASCHHWGVMQNIVTSTAKTWLHSVTSFGHQHHLVQVSKPDDLEDKCDEHSLWGCQGGDLL